MMGNSYSHPYGYAYDPYYQRPYYSSGYGHGHHHSSARYYYPSHSRSRSYRHGHGRRHHHHHSYSHGGYGQSYYPSGGVVYPPMVATPNYGYYGSPYRY